MKTLKDESDARNPAVERYLSIEIYYKPLIRFSSDMKRMIKIGIGGIALTMLSACGNGTPDYDATGTFEATEVIVSAEVAGKLLNLDIEEGKRLQTGEEIGLVDTLQLYLKKLQLEANMKSVESQRPDLAKQIAATKQQIATAEREKKRVENLLTAGAANQKQLDDWDAQVKTKN